MVATISPVTAFPESSHGRSMWSGLLGNSSDPSAISGRPFRRRADHSWPQRRQLYHAMTQVLSAAGSTGRPHIGQDAIAVAGNFRDISMPRATIVPPDNRAPNGANARNRFGYTGSIIHGAGDFPPSAKSFPRTLGRHPVRIH
jgi:hypothetical protein